MNHSVAAVFGAKYFTIISVAGITLLVGFGLGRVTSPNSSEGNLPGGRVGKIFDRDGDEGSASASLINASSDNKSGSAFSEQKLQQAISLSNPRLRERGMEEILARANLDEVKRALKWAESLPDGPGKKAAMADILERWAQMDGLGATNYAAQLYESTGNAGPLREALKGWAQTDPNRALQQLQSMGLADGLKADIRTDLVAQWTEQSPQTAAAYATSNRDTGSWQGLVATVANEWSKEDPKMAANWIGSLPAGLDQIHAINATISNWFQTNPSEVASYVSSQSPGQSRDMMALTLARQIGQEDPSAGLQWAVTVGDPKTQEKAATGAIVDIYRRDPQQAEQILGSSSLTSAVQAAVMTRLQSPGPWWR